MSLRDAAPPLAAASLWGGMYVVSKWGFASVPALTLAFLRVLVGGVALYAVLRARAATPALSARDRRAVLRLGVWVALTLATQFVGTDRTNASQGALPAATYSTLAAAPMLAVPAAVELAATDAAVVVSPGVVAAVAYLGLASTAAAWVLWYRGVERTTATVVAACFFAQPVVGAALGAAFLGETLGPGFAAGGALMGLGVCLVSTARAR